MEHTKKKLGATTLWYRRGLAARLRFVHPANEDGLGLLFHFPSSVRHPTAARGVTNFGSSRNSGSS
jgi:hypothetical protein